jgi:hypothetical protein
MKGSSLINHHYVMMPNLSFFLVRLMVFTADKPADAVLL